MKEISVATEAEGHVQGHPHAIHIKIMKVERCQDILSVLLK